MIAGLVHTKSTFRVLRYLRRCCHLQRVRPSGVRRYGVKELTAVLISGSDHPLSVFISKQQSTRGHVLNCKQQRLVDHKLRDKQNRFSPVKPCTDFLLNSKCFFTVWHCCRINSSAYWSTDNAVISNL